LAAPPNSAPRRRSARCVLAPIATLPGSCFLHRRIIDLIMLIPLLSPGGLSAPMLGLASPLLRRFGGIVKHDGDALPVRIARTLEPKKSRLHGAELRHAIGHPAVAIVPLGALRDEDDREERRRRRGA